MSGQTSASQWARMPDGPTMTIPGPFATARRAVTTTDDLDALSVGTVVLDAHGDVYVKRRATGENCGVTWERTGSTYGWKPQGMVRRSVTFTVLYDPTPQESAR